MITEESASARIYHYSISLQEYSGIIIFSRRMTWCKRVLLGRYSGQDA
jgi:hypothetical protein